MIEDVELATSALERFPSGVPGLDRILQGGFFRGGVYLFHARPGSGKTILGNQLCFRHVAAGGRAVVVTLLTESHSRLLAQLRPFEFFDASVVGAGLSYVTGYGALEKEGLKGLLGLLRQVIRDHKATMLVIDGIVTAGAMAESEIEVKKFVHELQSFVELVGCTTFLLTGASDAGEHYALRTMVDGLVELRVEATGMDTVRSIEVSKSRGSAALSGRHCFEINGEGICISPRLEAYRGRLVDGPAAPTASPAEFGVEALDAMLGGGLRPGSITLALGAPGSGKTLLGLNLLATGARLGEPGLYFGFFEAPADLRRRAGATGVDLPGSERDGLVELLWQSPLGAVADGLAESLLAHVERRGVRRLVIDGLGGFKDALVHADRWARFFGALCNELRSLGVATVVTDETRTLGEHGIPDPGLTAMLDNILCLRHVELRARVQRLVSILKQRDGVGDSSLHEFSIGPRGFSVSATSTIPERASGRGGSAQTSRPRRPR